MIGLCLDKTIKEPLDNYDETDDDEDEDLEKEEEMDLIQNIRVNKINELLLKLNWLISHI